MTRARALLLVMALAIASVGVAVADRRLGSIEAAAPGGPAVRFAEGGGIIGVRDGGRELGLGGEPGGFAIRAVGGTGNVLHNAGFEVDQDADGVPDGWSLVAGDGDLELSAAEPFAGGRALRVSTTTRTASPALVTELVVTPATEYVLSAWIRTEGLSPLLTTTAVTPARVEVHQIGAERRHASAFAFGYTGDSAWSRHDAGFRTAPGVRRIRVRVLIEDGLGTAWFDQLKIAPLLRPGPEPVPVRVEGDPSRVTVRGNVGPLALEATARALDGHLEIRGELSTTDRRDHAAQVSFTLPVDLEGWRWGDDARRERAIEEGTYANLSAPTPQGGSDTHAGISQIQRTSAYPFGGAADDRTALGIGVPMHEPRAFRISATEDGLTITFDLGVSGEARTGPRTSFAFVLFSAEGTWGFRALAERFAAIFPEDFERRTDPAREGAWFVAPPLGSLPGRAYRDFGLGLNMIALGKAPTQSWSEWGRDHVAWSNAREIYASAYTHQWAYYDPIRPSFHGAGGYDRDVADLEGSARGETTLGEDPQRRRDEARAALASTAHDVNGRLLYEIYQRYRAYYQNHDMGPDGGAWSRAVMAEQIERAIQAASDAGGRLDGIHMDSTSGARRWGAACDFDRRHWVHATIPLTFSYANGEPCQLGILSMYAQIERVSDLVRGRGMILSANFNGGADRALGWLGADRIDYFGIEQGLPDRAGGIDHVDRLALLKRTLAASRPVTSLDSAIAEGELSPEEIESRLNQSLLYGVFPGAWLRDENEAGQTEATWSTPANRALFATYSPRFRDLAGAGWEPVTHARCEDSAVWVERFGSSPEVFLTIRNETDVGRVCALAADPGALGFTGATDVDLVLGPGTISADLAEIRVPVEARRTIVLRLRARG